MSLLVVRVPAGSEAELAGDWLWSLGATAVEDRTDQPQPELVAGFDDRDTALAARSVLTERWPTRFEEPPDEAEWRDVWLAHLEPIVVGDFVIHPPWRPPTTAAGGPRALSIDPGRAFGSGHHPTTRLAIELLTHHLRPGQQVLDVGCGTGVLSIVALALGAGAVTGLDLDHDILEVARTNLEANGYDGRASLTTAAVSSAEVSDSRHDLVVANMTLGSLRPIAAALLAATGHTLIVTGLLLTQREPFEALVGRVADSQHGPLDGWVGLTFKPQ